MFRLRRTFFGLGDKYIESVYEQFFYMKYYGGWSFTEAYNLPVKVRDWFVNKLTEQLKMEHEEMESMTKSSQKQYK
tara:strand:+ start:17 stop:244 length:228 start_codon:yes stop_codon:yes gene_type:complete